MITLMISMNIASNGTGLTPEVMLALKRRFRDWHLNPVAALGYHRELWRLREFDTYQYTLSQRSFSDAQSDLRVRVCEGRIVNVCRFDETDVYKEFDHVGTDTGAIVGTVDDYFEWIERELSVAPQSTRACFHGLHGYPLSFSLAQIGQGQEKQRQWA